MFKFQTAGLALVVSLSPVLAQAKSSCQPKIEAAVRNWDFARKVYESNKSDFMSFVDCGSSFTSSMGTALHEILHNFNVGGRRISKDSTIGGQTSWYLPSGEKIPYPGGDAGDPVLNQFPPRSIAPLLQTRDMDYGFYVVNSKRATSAINFNKLLDELNSYGADTRFVIKLVDAGYPNNGNSSGGLFALATMVRTYLAAAERSHPQAWSRLQQGDYKSIIQKVWANAEVAIKAICARPEIMKQALAPGWARELIENRNPGALESLLGRRLDLPQACPSKSSVPHSNPLPPVAEQPPPKPRWPVIIQPGGSSGSGTSFILQ